jgi:hypothetical protein
MAREAAGGCPSRALGTHSYVEVGTRPGDTRAPIVPRAEQQSAKFGRVYLRNFSSLIPRARTLRYVAIAVVAFSFGGVMTVQAVAPSGIIGTVQLADRTNATQLAAVDAAGNVQVKVNNLAATQTVSGTVSVDNFPATQPVSGTVKATPTVATRSIDRFFGPIDAGKGGHDSFTSLNASFINVTSISGDIQVIISGSLGRSFYAFLGDNEVHTMSLTQQIPVNDIEVHCTNVVLPCAVQVLIFGD